MVAPWRARSTWHRCGGMSRHAAGRGAPAAARRTLRLRASGSSDGPLPSSIFEVVSWAEDRFRQDACGAGAAAAINLPKTCLLLALEEEAAAQLAGEPQTLDRCVRAASLAR